MVPHLLFLTMVVGLPIAVSIQIFRNEPAGRWFLVTYALAVLGSSLLFTVATLFLMFAKVGGLGSFDGILALIVSVPAALIIGLIIRVQRRSTTL